jgi:transcription elongation GreA/GreB family factor
MTEDEFLESIESSPEDVGKLFEFTRELKKRGEKEKPRVLLGRLAESQREKDLPMARLETLLEIARAFPNKAASAEEIGDAFREAYSEHPSLESLLTYYLKPKVSVAEAAERVRRWLGFSPGEVFYFAGHGAGRVVDLNPAIDSVRFEFERGEKLSLPPGAAAKNLIPLPKGDFRRERYEDRAGLAARALADPADSVRYLLQSVGRPLTATEIKESFAGVVPAEKWASFWNTSRKNPQLVLSGAGKNAVYSWTGSAQAAADSVRAEFDRAVPTRQLTIARQHARRAELSAYFAEKLAQALGRIGGSAPSLEIAFFLEESRAGVVSPVSVAEILAGPVGIERARELPDPGLRMRAYRLIRERDPAGAPELFSALFCREEDSRVLAYLDSVLRESASELRRSLLERIVRAPKTAPRAYLWIAEKRAELEGAASLWDAQALVSALPEALRAPEFAPYRARVKALFDRGGLALELVAKIPDEEEARRIQTAVERAPGLEDFRREDFRQALLRRFPDLQGPRVEPLYGTAESLAQRRAELEQLLTVEIPKNGRAIQEAAAMGDLSENFEYHAARARQEFLSARAATLQQELSRARPLDASKVDVSEVRVGTRVKLVSGAEEKLATILGPWDSNPEAAVYSYQSEFAQKLLGKKPGESVDLDGRLWQVAAIRPWKE